MLKKELHRLINKGRSFCHEERPFGVLGGILVEKDGFRIRLAKKHHIRVKRYLRRNCLKNISIHIYSAWGGFNSSIGAKSEYTLKIDPDDTEIYIYRGDGGYKLVLQKNAESGDWGSELLK